MDSILFEPASIKGVQIKNRFVRSATMEGLGTFDGRPSRRLKELYFKLTASAIVEGYKNIPKIKGLPFPLRIDEDSYVGDWKEVAEGVHERGS